jgi:succinate-semialdehyde dehydrogenase/glutarate-semialdehyde dehydrogenase
MAISTTNPATGETLKTFDELSDTELEAKLAAAAETFRTYRRTSFADRARWMIRAGEILDERTDEIGRLMTTEMGKPLAAAKAEVSKCA